MFKPALSVTRVLLVAILGLVAFSAAPGSSASNGQPFPPGSRVDGSHSDALLILHNLGTGAGLKVNSEGGGLGLTVVSKSNDGTSSGTSHKDKAGVYGWSTVGVGVKGRADNNDGVVGWTGAKGKSAVWGHSEVGVGVLGNSTNNDAVRGWSTAGIGVSGRSDKNDGIVGWTGSAGTSGVWGKSSAGIGVSGSSDKNDGIVGWTMSAGKSGVWGKSDKGTGVTGSGEKIGVMGWSDNGTGVSAHSKQGTALYVDGTSIFKNYASFEGGHGDLAENYYGSGNLEGGDVVVIDPASGLTLKLAGKVNDTAVAGIVSTAPAMKLKGLIEDDQGVPLVIAGRTLCKVDAGYGSIAPGDLLTTSPTPGHAMKAQPVRAGGVALYRPGTILGKALEAWEEGEGLIMVLVTLQ